MEFTTFFKNRPTLQVAGRKIKLQSKLIYRPQISTKHPKIPRETQRFIRMEVILHPTVYGVKMRAKHAVTPPVADCRPVPYLHRPKMPQFEHQDGKKAVATVCFAYFSLHIWAL